MSGAKYKVRYDKIALDALEEAALYIEKNSGAGRASAWLHAMRGSVQKLETLPRAFPVACRRQNRAVHSKRILSHRVFYFIDEPERIVYVVDVIHTAQETRLAMYREQEAGQD